MPPKQAPPPLLRSKLHRPRVTLELLCRRRLHEILDAGATTALTLVSASAGYGKSMLVSHWLELRDEPFAWLSLDEDDATLEAFLRGFVAAVKGIFPTSCQETEALLGQQNGPLALAVRTLVNDLEGIETPFSMVLDDYHRLGSAPEVQELVRLLLDHPPPSLRLVIISRSDPPLPLSTYRALGQLTEVRLSDLRFTRSETRTLFDARGQRDVTDEALGNLDYQFEGWAVGLHLALLSLRRVEDRDAFLRSLHGGFATVQEYLLHEVLAGLPSELQDWVLRTSILDRFCPGLCEAVCVSQDISAPSGLDGRTFIQAIDKEGIFSIALSAELQWHRYHHQFQYLCRIELGRRSTAEDIADLHLRACTWLSDQGLLDEAIHHALLAGDAERAVRLVEANRRKFLNSDRYFLLHKWVVQLPEEAVERSPELLLARAWALFFRFDLVALPQLLDDVDALLAHRDADQSLAGEVDYFRGYIAYFTGNGTQSQAYLERAVARLSREQIEVLSEAELHFALATQMVDGLEAARQVIAPRLAELDALPILQQTRVLASRAFSDLIGADLTDALAMGKLLETVARKSEYRYATAWGLYVQAAAHFLRHELPQAESLLRQTVGQRHCLHRRAVADAMGALALTLERLDRGGEADAMLERLAEFARDCVDVSLLAFTESVTRRLSILRGGAVESPPRSEQAPGVEAMIFWLEVPEITDCRVLVAQATPESLEEAQRRLQECLEWNRGQHNVQHQIEALVLLAVTQDGQGRSTEALQFLEKALVLAAPGGLAWPFVELGPPLAELMRRLPAPRETGAFSSRVLKLFGGVEAAERAAVEPTGSLASESSSSLHGIDSLTDREQEILELLAARLQNKEIAQRLHISTHTVNDHLKHVYEKLGVHGRRQAVARAKTPGIATDRQV